MKKNPGRKERRRLARANRRAEGRLRAKINERMQKSGFVQPKVEEGRSDDK